MALLLAGLPDSVPGVTLNRLCASGLEAVGTAARAIRAGEMEFAIAGGVESMTRAPFVQGKARGGLLAHGRNLRHHHRLALHQSADEERNTASIRCRRPARTWPRNSRSPAPIRTPLRCARSSAPARRWPPAISPRRSFRSRLPGRKGDTVKVDKDEHPRRHHARAARQAEDAVPQSGHGDRRQCLRRQ